MVNNIIKGKGYWPVRLSKFMVSICSVRELPWFSSKSANFSKIYDTRYRRGKHSKSFSWIYNSAAIDNITANRGIITGKDYRFI